MTQIWARDHLDTEDIVQDTLMQSVRRLDQFTPEHQHAFCAYVCEALRNRLRDVLRRAACRPSGSPLSLDAPAADPSPPATRITAPHRNQAVSVVGFGFDGFFVMYVAFSDGSVSKLASFKFK